MKRARQRHALRWSAFVGGFAFLAVALTAAVQSARGSDDSRHERVLLFTTLPILWPETERVDQVLTSANAAHWALAPLTEAGEVRGVDALVNRQDESSIGNARLLVMAQPRPLSPAENVALDRWVRNGGHVLLFADPMLTAESAFAIGDRRRPQDIVLLSPILGRWGLQLEYLEDQPAGERQEALLGAYIPVNQSGRFALSGGSDGCRIIDAGLAAICMPGQGKVIAIADAALLDNGGGKERNTREAMLRRLLAEALS